MTNKPAHQSLIAQKADLRRIVLARRDQFAENVGHAAAAAQAVAARIISESANPNLPLHKLSSAGVVAGYWPIRNELDPRPLLKLLAARGLGLALPVITPSGMVFRRWRQEQKLVSAGFGTFGPDADQPVVDPDVLLVPLAGFDRRGNRLGYGQGNYDIAIACLTAAQKRPMTIGLAFDVQEIDSLPTEPHDQALDVIITPMQSISYHQPDA